jgi:hypothetical protein
MVEPAQIGRTLRWLFNLYDPDHSRIEFIEATLAFMKQSR